MHLFAFFFFNPLSALAVAAGAISIPIIIHLLNRKRFRVVTWAAMRFLLAAQKQNVRRMRLEQLILLALRVTILLLLVLAMISGTDWGDKFWNSFLPSSWGAAGGSRAAGRRTHKILVIDGSFSMALKTPKGDGDDQTTCFDRARQLAKDILQPGRGDGFSVVLMASPPRRVVPEPSEDAARVADEVQALRLPHGNADLAATLNVVEDMLRQSPSKFKEREVYFLTDLQHSTWLEGQTGASGSQGGNLKALVQKIQAARARTIFVDVGKDKVDNVAVIDLVLKAPLATTGAVIPITATIYNYGSTKDRVRVELWAGRARANAGDPAFELRPVNQPPPVKLTHGLNTISFPYKFTTPGEYVVQVRVENDALDLDDVRSAVITVKNTVPVMLVNGKPAAQPFDRATEWLRFALNPFDAGPIPGTIPARPKVVSVDEFNDVGRGDLTNFDCVFLCDMKGFSDGEVRRLETHLRRGGGVVFCLGDQVEDFGAYNDRLYQGGAGILPARLLSKQPAPENHFFHFHTDPEKGYKQPPLDAFAGDRDRASLLATRFRQYVRAQPAPVGQPRTILSFLPEAAPGKKPDLDLPRDDPAILEWNPPLPRDAKNSEVRRNARYRGRVVLITTAVNMDWSSWPASPSYLPFMQELLRYAVAGRVREQAAIVGDVLEAYLQTSGTGVEVSVHTPDGRQETARTLPFNEASMLRWAGTDVSGVYRVTVGQDPQEYLFAVNVPTATEAQQACESDPRRTTPEDLKAAYPDWEFQVVTDLDQVVATPLPGGDASEGSVQEAEPGTDLETGKSVARVLLLAFLVLLLVEVVLAWHFGHFSAVAGTPGVEAARGRLFPVLTAVVGGLLFLALAGVLVHAAWKQDFLGFLGDGLRRNLETGAYLPEFLRPAFALAPDLPPPAPGESPHWKLEAAPGTPSYLTDPWLVGAFAVAAAGLIFVIHRREGQTAGGAYKLLLTGLRVGIVLFALVVLLPLLQVRIERQGWPDVAIIIDDSYSMSTVDRYQDPEVQKAADELARVAELTSQERLQLAQALLTRPDTDLLTTLLTRRQVKIHVYRCSTRAGRIADVSEAEQLAPTLQAIKQLRADPTNDASQLGTAVRQVLNDFRGSSLAAVIMLTDGITTEGEDLVKVSRYAAQADVPLLFVGIGDAQEARDLILHDLQVDDSVFVNDRLVFEARLTGKSYPNRTAKVRVREKGKDKVLAEQEVKVDPQGKPVKVRLVHQPAEPGEKIFVVEVQPFDDEAQLDNNSLERTVLVHETKLLKVLYVEGYPRYEYRFLKTLLERESARTKGNKSIDLKVLLIESDPDFVTQDKSAIAEFPSKTELNQFDVVILGDVEAKHKKLEKNLAHLAEFVRERGGGLLLIAGERYAPHTYKDSPLKDILPIDVLAERQDEPARGRPEGFRPELTPMGRLHQIFKFSSDESKSDEIWGQLKEVYWWSEGYRKKPAAEVLAVHPKQKSLEEGKRAGEDNHPLVVHQFVGAGRSMFFGINETWRWRMRENEGYFNNFWIQTVRYLGRSRLGRVELRLDRQTPYRRGEPIKMTVRFPDDAPPPVAETEVKVVVERKTGAAPIDPETVTLAKVDGSRATYEGLLTRTPEGEYRFSLSAPAVTGNKPQAQCKVLAPPGEMEHLQMNRPDLERAAEETHGRFFTLADADQLLEFLPRGKRVTLNASARPWFLWNLALLFAVAVLFLTTEWVLRKRKHLL